MLTYILNILCAIASTVLFLKAPHHYDYMYCCVLMWLYIAQNVLYFATNKRKNWFGFEFIFCLSFFFVNFVYPVFYYPMRPHFSFFAMPFNANVITRSTALAYFGYAWYLLGATRIFRMQREEPDAPTFQIGMNQYLCFFVVTALSFALFVVTGGVRQLQSVYSGGGMLGDVGIYSYFNNIFTIGCYAMAIFLFRIKPKHRWFYALALLFCLSVILMTGSRQLTIGIVLILAVGFSMYVRHLKFWQILLLMLAGACALFLIMSVRKLGFDPALWQRKMSGMQLQSILDIFEDLIINDLNLFVLVEYADTHPLTWFHGMLLDITSPIPGVANKIIAMAGEPKELLHGGDLPSYILLGANACWGTGTNMVGEAYRSFGLIGTALAMMLIGFLVKESFYRAKDSVYWYMLYFLFVSHALIYPRAPLLFDPRLVVWSLGLLWVIMTATQKMSPFVSKIITFKESNGNQ